MIIKTKATQSRWYFLDYARTWMNTLSILIIN